MTAPEVDPWAVVARLAAVVRQRLAMHDLAHGQSVAAIKAAGEAGESLGDALAAYRRLTTALVDGAGHDRKGRPSLDDAVSEALRVIAPADLARADAIAWLEALGADEQPT